MLTLLKTITAHHKCKPYELTDLNSLKGGRIKDTQTSLQLKVFQHLVWNNTKPRRKRRYLQTLAAGAPPNLRQRRPCRLLLASSSLGAGSSVIKRRKGSGVLH